MFLSRGKRRKREPSLRVSIDLWMIVGLDDSKFERRFWIVKLKKIFSFWRVVQFEILWDLNDMIENFILMRKYCNKDHKSLILVIFCNLQLNDHKLTFLFCLRVIFPLDEATFPISSQSAQFWENILCQDWHYFCFWIDLII
jgi:hypothetical protein